MSGVVFDSDKSTISINGVGAPGSSDRVIPFFIIKSDDGTPYYIHVDNSGVLRIGSSRPVTNTAGTAVGDQSGES